MTDYDTPGPARRVRGALRVLAIVGRFADPLALVGVIVAFRCVGERWWVTLAAMYLPRIGFALPLPFVAVAIILWGP
jgi:hypothetical protein